MHNSNAVLISRPLEVGVLSCQLVAALAIECVVFRIEMLSWGNVCCLFMVGPQSVTTNSRVCRPPVLLLLWQAASKLAGLIRKPSTLAVTPKAGLSA